MGAAREGSPESASLSSVVRAAGGIVLRNAGSGFQVLVVHRPSHADWTFPKGKVEPGESDEECAVREVREETGLLCTLCEELASTSYTDAAGRPKQVRYWRMDVAGGELVLDNEVDDARWLSVDDAAAILTYDRDRVLLESL